MSEFISKVHDSVDCQVRNCKIGVIVRCSAYYLREALQYGKSHMNTYADHDGCSSFSEEEVKIFYDSNGIAIDYELPYTDPKTVLDFTVFASLVKYGTDPQNLFIGTNNLVADNEWGELLQSFDSLLHSTSKMNRHFFPPDPIYVDGEPYEVAAVTVCDNYKCFNNLGKMDIAPLPLITK